MSPPIVRKRAPAENLRAMNESGSSQARAWLRHPWRSLRSWLADVPVVDPVERRNAPMVQLVLLVLAVAASLLWIYRIVFSGIPWRSGETVDLLTSLGVIVVCLGGVILIRRGRFQRATRMVLAVVALMLLAASARNGFDGQAYEQPMQVVWLVLAGLIVGRPALWCMYAVLVLAIVLGIATDIAADLPTAAAPPRHAVSDRIGSGIIAATIFLLVTLAIDRSVAALRATLREANRRGDQLALANARLGEEIAERERLTEQLIHARKVEAVGHLASGVAHDFNHLLGLILGHARRGMRSDGLTAAKDALGGIDSAARRATAVAQTLLNFSRRDATRVEVFDANEALAELQPMLTQLFGAGVRLDIEPSAGPARISFDRNQFSLLVLNIATNAHQAMPEGGRFRIAVDAGTTDTVSISFADTGQGMSDEVRGRIFEPFFTTKPAGQGTGLGLAVVANLIAAAGGRIAVDSRPDHGSLFHIELPHGF